MSDAADIPDRLMEDPELAAPEIDSVEGAPIHEDPKHPDLPAT